MACRRRGEWGRVGRELPSRWVGCKLCLRVAVMAAAIGPWGVGRAVMRRLNKSMRARRQQEGQDKLRKHGQWLK